MYYLTNISRLGLILQVWRSNDGILCRTLEGHAHWVNTLALSTDYVLRTGPFHPVSDQIKSKIDDSKSPNHWHKICYILWNSIIVVMPIAIFRIRPSEKSTGKIWSSVQARCRETGVRVRWLHTIPVASWKRKETYGSYDWPPTANKWCKIFSRYKVKGLQTSKSKHDILIYWIFITMFFLHQDYSISFIWQISEALGSSYWEIHNHTQRPCAGGLHGGMVSWFQASTEF